MTEVNVILNAVKDLKKIDSSPRLRMTKQCKTRNDRGNVILNAVKDLKKKDSSPRLRMTKQCKAQNDEAMQGSE